MKLILLCLTLLFISCTSSSNVVKSQNLDDDEIVFSLAYNKASYNKCVNPNAFSQKKTIIDSTFGFQIDYNSEWFVDTLGSDEYYKTHTIVADSLTNTKMIINIDDSLYTKEGVSDLMKIMYSRDSVTVPIDNDSCLWYNIIADVTDDSYIQSTYYYYSKRNQRFYTILVFKKFRKDDDVIIGCFFKESLESFRTF